MLVSVSLTACGSQPTSTLQPTAPIEQDTIQPTEIISTPVESPDPDCPGNGINPLGQSIADDYDFVDYNQIMAWFCEGAEFEDILVALETEALTNEPAGEMLQMLADGMTWQEIWFFFELTD